ncbi:hypothetical protein P3C80_30825 [Pseudomonas aeruginosa]|uniref:hypothetical protein n=1 Tax=Pseudomonas aeruginosa TaxID=287 RepID=UPI0021F1287F|nr:hypothetical protein [Pseudomonas aeruginosa]MCV6104768.1 hypothetical protein [Pseudomonas aeruginosa]MDI2201436.1 hypothetical protein [Pseudomonas aeruginosa]HBO3958475.1 hypothetical protein [Pseudomonas aeruginosa]HCF6078372.1 hypothetical protein [Pseudomonas aeruginosa]HEP8279024.1 hypothetical protein [Pseudomonas aeruginosa]
MNVIIINSPGAVVPSDFSPVYIDSVSGLEKAVLELKHKCEKCVVMRTSAESVLAAYKLNLGVINESGQWMYSVKEAGTTDQISDTFYTVEQMKIAALVESVKTVGEARKNIARIISEIEKSSDFLSQHTLSYIISSSAKYGEISEFVMAALAKSRESFEAKVRSMILPEAGQQIDNKTFEPSGFVVNASEMGTSKSESNMKLFEKALAAGRKPMLFVPNISLVSPFSMRDEHYKNVCDAEGRQIMKSGAITTINSAKLSAHTDLIANGEVKIFDEAVKLFEHMNGDAFFEGRIADKKAGFQFVFEQMKAQDVVISDAHFGQAYIDIVKNVVGREISAVEMPRGSYQKLRVNAGNLKVEDLISRAKKMLRAGERFCFYSDRKQQDAIAVYKELSEFASSKGMKSIMINAAEMVDEEGDAYKATVNPDQELTDKSMIFFSPAIGPGFSACLPEVKAILMDCCGSVSPISLIQTAFRFRCVENIYIAFSIRKPPAALPETRSDVCYRAIESSEVVAVSNIDSNESIMTFMNKEHDKLMSDKVMCAAFDFKALENWSRNRYKRFVLKAMELLGFNMSHAFTDADDVASEKPKKLDRIKAEKLETKSVFLSDEVLSAESADALKKKAKASGITLDESRLLDKFVAGKMMGIKGAFSAEDYEFVEKGGLQIIENISRNISFKKSTSGQVTMDALSKSEIISNIHDFVIAESARSDGFQNENVVRFIEKLKFEKLTYNGKQTKKITLIKNFFMLNIDTKDARKSLNAIVGLLGYSLKSNASSKVRVGDERKNSVVLNSDLHEKAVAYREMARNAHD